MAYGKTWHKEGTYYARNRERILAEANAKNAVLRTSAMGRSPPAECEVCKRELRLVLDHCHKTGRLRGWVCYSCNIALGQVRDDAELLRKLALYLEHYTQPIPTAKP